MTAIEATAEIFWTAFRVLSRKERGAFLKKLENDDALIEDLRDLLVIKEREKEPTITLDEYLATRRKR